MPGGYSAERVVQHREDLGRLAAYHINNGARDFAGFKAAMVDDLGEGIRPHLRELYDDVRAQAGPEVIRYKGRDIVRVETADGRVQPFYRSTGNNSRRAGEWFPFDGLEEDPASEMGRGWMKKDRFAEGALEDPRHPLHRYGSDELRAHGESLRGQDVPPGREVSTPEEVNRWLRGEEPAPHHSTRQPRTPEGRFDGPPRSAAAVAEDIRVTHARERADFYAREAAGAKDPVRRAEAERLAREYADEAAEAHVSDVARRVKSGAEVAPEEMADLERAVLAEDGTPTYIEVDAASPAPAAAAAPARAVRSPLRRAFDAGLDVFDATKSMFASLDVSAAGRQTFVPFLFDTRATLRGLLKGSPSALPGWHNDFVRWLDAQPDAKMWRDFGLDLDAMTGSGTHNEFFTSHLAEKIPGYGPAVIKPSDRVMTAQLDAVRLHNARSWDESLRAMGATPETHPEDYRAVAKLINTASGRAELGKVGQAMYPVTRRVIFSPKLLSSSRVGSPS